MINQSSRRCGFHLIIMIIWVCCGAATAGAAEDVPYTLAELFKRVPPLKHDATGRWPMIAFEPFKLSADDKSFDQARPFPPEVIRELSRRGLTQFLRPTEAYIPFALALQKQGARVILMEGMSFNGPAGDVPDGLHKLPADFKRDPDQPPQQPHYPCPLLLEGWRKRAEELRATFGKFKAAGVHVDAVWGDWEVEPYPGRSQWLEARACSHCRTQFPPGVLDDFERYQAFMWRWRVGLFSAYVVAPILESYPSCSITNWEEVISTAEHPTTRWGGGHTKPPVGLGLYTAANPVVYGNTAWYARDWKPQRNWPLDAIHMDRVYTNVMLSEISDHAYNAMRSAPEKQCIPWVCRYCDDEHNEKVPILTRPRYREILRHCWLRGADGMQIFNPNLYPTRPEKVAIMTEEIEDAVAIYDEMLEFRPVLDNGVVMNTEIPAAEYDGPIWSGRQLGSTAVVRVFTQGSVPTKAEVQITGTGAKPMKVVLDCPPTGRTYRLSLKDNAVIVDAIP